MTDGQLELFADPGPPTLAPPRMATPPRATRYARFKPRTRTLCDDCTQDIHRLGVDLAPYPNRAAWRCTQVDGEVRLICHRHKQERQDHDSK